MHKEHRWCRAHGCMKRARGCTTHGCITHRCREEARGCIGRAQGCVSYGCIWVSRGSLGAGVHLVYLEDVAHRCRKGAQECITHGCVAWAWVARRVKLRSLPGVPEVVPGGCTEG